MRRAVRVVACFETFKGALVLVAATGLLSLLHRDLHALALKLVEHAHLDPASKYPEIFVNAASNLQDSRLVALALGAAAYSVFRFVEAYGLFRGRAWAEVLAAGSGAIYLPVEAAALVRHPTLLHILLIVANIIVVLIMVAAFLRRRRRAAQNDS